MRVFKISCLLMLSIVLSLSAQSSSVDGSEYTPAPSGSGIAESSTTGLGSSPGRKSNQEYSRGVIIGGQMGFCCCYFALEPDSGYDECPCLCDDWVDLSPFVGEHVEIWGYLEMCIEGGTIEFHVTQLQTLTGVADETESGVFPVFSLKQNHPNPFNAVTAIRYAIGGGQRSIRISLRIYDILGRKVKTLVNEAQTAGVYEVSWDGKDQQGKTVASGVYFYRLETSEFSQTKRMVLLK